MAPRCHGYGFWGSVNTPPGALGPPAVAHTLFLDHAHDPAIDIVRDLYLDQALFAARVRTHATTKTSPFYLVYGKHPRLLGDDNHPLDVNTPIADYRSRLEAVQSARQQASRVTYERALR